MHFINIGDAAFIATLSYYSNASVTKKSPEIYLRNFLERKIKSRNYSVVVGRYYSSLLTRIRSRSDLKPLLTTLNEIWRSANKTESHMRKSKFLEVSIQDRLLNFRDKLVENGYHDLVDSNITKSSHTGNVIYVDQENYALFDGKGALRERMNLKLRTDDYYLVAKSAYESGLILALTNQFDLTYNFWIFPENNATSAIFPVGTREHFEVRQRNIDRIKRSVKISQRNRR